MTKNRLIFRDGPYDGETRDGPFMPSIGLRRDPNDPRSGVVMYAMDESTLKKTETGVECVFVCQDPPPERKRARK
jgi:hypothetical protein